MFNRSLNTYWENSKLWKIHLNFVFLFQKYSWTFKYFTNTLNFEKKLNNTLTINIWMETVTTSFQKYHWTFKNCINILNLKNKLKNDITINIWTKTIYRYPITFLFHFLSLLCLNLCPNTFLFSLFFPHLLWYPLAPIFPISNQGILAIEK